MTQTPPGGRQSVLHRIYGGLVGKDSPVGFAQLLVAVSVVLIAFFWVTCALLAWAQSCNPHQFLKIMVAADMIALASALLGAFLGFLFALPRYQQEKNDLNPGLPSYLDNTNLLDVSDWLTKIIVGLGLVQITKLSSALVQLGRTLEPVLGYVPSDKGSPACGTAVTTEGAIAAIGVAICLSAVVAAFLVGYLWTRVTFTRLMRDYDEREAERKALADKAR